MDSTPPPIRKGRFRARFSLRTLLVITLLLGVVLGPIAQRTLQQMRVCELLRASRGKFSYSLNDPPGWLTFLPNNWLAAAHWCRSFHTISLSIDTRRTQSENHADLRERLAIVARLPRLDSLELNIIGLTGSEPTFADTLSPLATLHGLRQLRIFTEQCNTTLSALPDMPHLQSLIIGHDEAPLSKKAVNTVLKFPRLEYFDTSCEYLEDDALDALATLPHLRSFRASYLRTTDSDLDCFVGHQTLEELLVAKPYCGDDFLRIIASCPKIKSIQLEASLITDTGLSYLKDLQHLEEIDVNNTAISDAGFPHLANCKSLRRINAAACKLTNAIGPTLSQLPKLQSLELSNTLTTSNLLEHLTSLEHLEKLYLGDNRSNLDKLMAFVQQRNVPLSPNWKYSFPRSWYAAVYHFGNTPEATNHMTYPRVDLSEIRGIHGQLSKLRDPNQIQGLNLSGSDIDDEDLKVLALLPNLRELDVSNTAVTTAGLANLANTPRLNDLAIGPMDAPDDALKIVSSLSALQELTFAGAEDLSSTGLAYFQKLQFLEKLKFPNCDINPPLASAICELPYVKEIRWSIPVWYEPEIATQRLQNVRTAYGAPLGLQKWLATNPQQSSVTIVDESELLSLVGNNVTTLNAAGIQLSSNALKTIAQLTQLRELDLSNTGLTDVDLSQLSGLTNLSSLKLNKNHISDSGIGGLLSSGNLYELEISNTKVGQSGLSRLLQSNKLYKAKLSNLPDLPDLLKHLPTADLPENIGVGPDGFDITRESIKILRSELPPDRLWQLTICPTMLQAWTLDELFHSRYQLPALAICETQRVPEILRAATKACPNLRLLKIANESLTSIDSNAIPNSLREIDFFNCIIDTPTLQAVSTCPLLRRLRFISCKLEGCSLEPLLHMPLLVEVSTWKTPLSSDQSQVFGRLQPPLIYNSSEMFYLIEWDRH